MTSPNKPVPNHVWSFETCLNLQFSSTEVVPELFPKSQPNPKCLLSCIPDSLLQPSVGPGLFNKEQVGPYEDEGVARYVEVRVQ